MKKKVLVFGMDGNVIDNYYFKANCAGRAMFENAIKYFGVKKSINFFSDVYLETSGMNSLKQFQIGYEKIFDKEITKEILEKTELDFRKYLKTTEEFKMFEDVKTFLEENKGKYFFIITTTVPVNNILDIVGKLNLDKHFDMICCRNGFWQKGKIKKILDFDKGKEHYNFIKKSFNVNSENIVAISSTKADIENAINQGICSVALEHIFKKDILKKLKPDFIAKDCLEVQDFLEN
jgi:hypothetical protein